MAMVLQGVLIVMLALAALVVIMLVVAVRRLTLMRWQPVRSRTVAREEVPARLRAILERPAAGLEQLGFVYRYSGATLKMLVTPQNESIFFDVYQHRDGHTHAMVSPSPMPEPQQPCMLQLITCFQDGNNWLTLNRCRHFSPIDLPRWQTVDDYLPQWEQAWHRHLQRVQAATAPICTDGVEVYKRLHQTFEDLVPHLQHQGQFVPAGGDSGHFRLTVLAAAHMSLKVLGGQLRASWTAPQQPTALHTQQQGLDADLRAFQDQLAASRTATSSTRSKWVTFIVTAVLFLLVGGLWLSWAFVPIVLAVVALHEGGHYLAMKLTGFRNVSVFFVPGLGGLATGEKVTATPLEKLFVYLAGPVPGIALAGIAFWASASGYWSGPGWLNEFLIASLVINYLNLLPLMPLDGGRVLETLVFARHPRLRFGFAAVCCVALFGLGAFLDDIVLRVVAVLIAFGLPYQWRRMQLDQAVLRESNAALDEPQALQHIFSALQSTRFQSWSFAKRTAAASALLPELMGRRANRVEALVGVLIYSVCLLAPVGVAFVATPLGAVISALTPGLRVPPDDVEPEPARAPMPPPADSNTPLAEAKEQQAYEDVTSGERVALLREALELRAGSNTDTHFAVATTRLHLARALDADGDSSGAQVQLQVRVNSLPIPAAEDRSRTALNRRVGRVLATVDLAWFLIAHGRTAEALQTAQQARAELPVNTTVSWLNPSQQVLEVLVWSEIVLQRSEELASHWAAYEAARRSGLAGARKVLVMEVDRAIVAQVLGDAGMRAQANSGIGEALAKTKGPITLLCRPLSTGPDVNWRAPQQQARQRMLAAMGLCATASDTP